MKVLIAYDGSPYADAALAGLTRAGLPRETSVLVATACEICPPDPPLSGEEATEAVLATGRVSTALARAYERAMKAQSDAYLLALGASERVRKLNPTWEGAAEVLSGSPARKIVGRARKWQADLVVVGSQGRSTLGRLVLGSVSRQVAAEANCSVRVGRHDLAYGDDTGLRIIVGVDGSTGAERAVRAVGARTWHGGTQVRVVVVDDGRTPMKVADVPPDEAVLVTGCNEAGAVKARLMAEWACEEMNKAGLAASTEIREGEPQRVLAEEARAWGVHS
ncbi:MAG TPA: universal stress protein, partial [Pyrinomonadaceae bacterium]|nr:universal stress protein [Pyrinomonadaceae bacterium]